MQKTPFLYGKLCSLLHRGQSADPQIRPTALGWRGALVKDLHREVVYLNCGSQLNLDSARAARGCPKCNEPFPVRKLSGSFGTMPLEKSVTILGQGDLSGDTSVSTRQAAIHRLGREYRSDDLRSLNGVWKLTPSNGWVSIQSRFEPNQKPLIQAIDRLRLGKSEVVVCAGLTFNCNRPRHFD